VRDYTAYFAYGVRDPRWGPSRLDRPANGHIRTAPRPPRPQRPDLPAARNPDGSYKVQPVADRSAAERRAIAVAMDYIRGFETR
jgi:hypothetical protein